MTARVRNDDVGERRDVMATFELGGQVHSRSQPGMARDQRQGADLAVAGGAGEREHGEVEPVRSVAPVRALLGVPTAIVCLLVCDAASAARCPPAA